MRERAAAGICRINHQRLLHNTRPKMGDQQSWFSENILSLLEGVEIWIQCWRVGGGLRQLVSECKLSDPRDPSASVRDSGDLLTNYHS